MISRHKRTFIRLVEQCHRIYSNPQNSVKECLDVQETLIQKISYIERRIRERRQAIKNLKLQLGGHDIVRLSKNEARKVKDKIEQYHHQIDEYQELAVVYRDFGDALAFSYIDKWDIKPLAVKEASGALSGKKGAGLERKILRKVFSLGHVAILNDITNCLRYGDITMPKDGKFAIVEAKSGKHRTDRDIRQATEAQNLLNFYVTDTTDKLYKENGSFKRIGFGAKEIHHRAAINGLIFEAIKNGISFAEIESGLFYIVSTHFNPEIASDLLKKCIGKPFAGLLSQYNRDNIYFPVILAIQDPESVYKFYTGQITIVTIVDSGIIESKLRSHNLHFRIIENDDEWIAEVIEDEMPLVKIGYSLWFRLYAEFVSLDWFITEIIIRLIKSSVSDSK